MDGSDSQPNCSLESGKSSPLHTLQLITGKIPVEICESGEKSGQWERRGKIAADFGGLILGLASLLISLAALVFTYLISDRQNELKKQEVQTASEEQRVKFLAELNDKVFAELNDKEFAKRQLAAIRLASYGDTALPSLKAALGVQDPYVRQGAVEVVSQMFRSETVDRSTLIKSLLDYSKANNPSLRRSTLECLVGILQSLDPREKLDIANVVKERINAEQCSNQDGAYVITSTVVFLANSGSSEAPGLLVKVSENTSCNDVTPRRVAIDNLPKAVRQLPVGKRAEILTGLRKLMESAPDELKINIAASIKAIEESL